MITRLHKIGKVHAISVFYKVKPKEKIEMINSYQDKALIKSVFENNIEATRHLLLQGHNVNYIDVVTGLTPLLTATINPSYKMIKLLLEYEPDLNKQDPLGNTPLMRLCFGQDCPSTIKLFLDAGADIQYKNNNGFTALAIAYCHGAVETAKLLVEHGASLSELYHNGRSLVPIESTNNISINDPSPKSEEIPEGTLVQEDVSITSNKIEGNIKQTRFQLYFGTFKKSFTFSGRSSRKEFWIFTLVNILIMLVLAIAEANLIKHCNKDFSIWAGTYWLIVFIPTLAVATRRLHDTGLSAFYLILNIIPIGPIIFLFMMTRKGDKEPNKYGVPPVE